MSAHVSSPRTTESPRPAIRPASARWRSRARSAAIRPPHTPCCPMSQCRSDSVRQWPRTGQVARGAALSLDRYAADSAPEEGIEAAVFFLDFKECAGVLHRAFDLRAIPDQTLVLQEARPIPRGEPRDLHRVEPGKSTPVVFALAEDRHPAEPGLRPLERQHFEQDAVVVDGHSPLFVVVSRHQRVVARPVAALRGLHAGGWSFWPRGASRHFAAGAEQPYRHERRRQSEA